MEKKPAPKSMNKILKLIPKAAQASVSFQNPPYSPARDKRPNANWHKLKTHLSKGLSGPIVSMIPAEAREKTKNFETQEPTSPKISCIGQIKHKKKICSKKRPDYLPKEFRPVSYPQPEKFSKARSAGLAAEPRKKPSGIKKIFSARRKSDASVDLSKPPLPDRVPSLSQMRKFASSRDTLANFDWTTAQISRDDHCLCSDEDRDYSDGEDEATIPFSAQILMTGAGAVLEPRKEINLWKRRSMVKPKPLQINIV